MKAMILAGGMGKRLRPFTFMIPKPLFPIGRRSILEFIVERLKLAGIDEVFVSIGYLGDLVRAFCGDGSKFGVRFTYLQEDKPLGTAGPLRLLDGMLDAEENLLLINGDVVTLLDLTKLVRFHEQHGCELTISYRELQDTSPYGVLEVEGDEVKQITEKPSRRYDVSMGIYVVSPTVIEQIPPDECFTIPELANKLAAKRRKVGAFRVAEFWLAVEHFSDFAEVQLALKHLGKNERKA